MISNNSKPFLLLMPSYNQKHYIVEAVQSVLQQQDQNWQLWIVDNSSDGTPDVMKQFNDERIHFHHIPRRMDPGTCLNWMLERVQGHAFSYIHTDNNLRKDYVGKMRQFLDEREEAITYCDMRTIDEHGKVMNLYRRGAFDFQRLLSLNTLGVPFAATLSLAKKLEGFSSKDYADDVRFCVMAWGLADFHYLPEPLLDYRMHSQSRTTEAGGANSMQKVFCQLFNTLKPTFLQRDIDIVAFTAKMAIDKLNELDQHFENIYYRRAYRSKAWGDSYSLEAWYQKGWLPLKKQYWFEQKLQPWSWQRIYIRKEKKPLKHRILELSDLVVPWAALSQENWREALVFSISNQDFKSKLIAKILEEKMGWKLQPLQNNNQQPVLICAETLSWA
jgi:glycosyltransferase involved in cell wall biosynthesis